jgi:hypothetical protein
MQVEVVSSSFVPGPHVTCSEQEAFAIRAAAPSKPIPPRHTDFFMELSIVCWLVFGVFADTEFVGVFVLAPRQERGLTEHLDARERRRSR